MWQRVKDAGATVNVCPRSDAQYGLGEGVFAFQKALDHGMRPGFSIDNEVSYGTDMFTEMRVAFNVQRAMATYRKVNGDAKASALVSVREVLECATAGGAACAGLLDKCGTLTPGKEADIVMIRTDDINLYPSNHAIGTVVSAADVRNIDTVIIGGRIRKFARPDGGREHGQVPSDGRRIANVSVHEGRLQARHLLEERFSIGAIHGAPSRAAQSVLPSLRDSTVSIDVRASKQH